MIRKKKGPKMTIKEVLIKLLVPGPGGRMGWFITLPEREQGKLRHYAERVIKEKNFTYARWCGRGKLFGRRRYVYYVGLFISRGWLCWLDRADQRRGLGITVEGQIAFEWLAKNPPALFKEFINGFKPVGGVHSTQSTKVMRW